MIQPSRFSSIRITSFVPLILGACIAFGAAPSRLLAQEASTPLPNDRPPGARATHEQNPVISYDRIPGESSALPSNASLPSSLALPAGTVITVRTTDWLSSDSSRAGDTFTVTLEQPLVVDGWVVARRGQMAIGAVAVAQKAGRVHGVSQLGIHLAGLTLVDGQQLPLDSQLVQYSGGTSHGADAVAIGGTSGFGAMLGAIAGGGAGAGIGAAAGAAAGLIGVLSTRGRPTVIPPESLLTFRATTPLTISTAKSQRAFRPVSQSDYGNRYAYSRSGPPPQGQGGYGYGHPLPPPYYGYAYAPYPYYGYGYGYPYYPPFYFGYSTLHYGGHGYYGYHGYRGHGGFYGRH